MRPKNRRVASRACALAPRPRDSACLCRPRDLDDADGGLSAHPGVSQAARIAQRPRAVGAVPPLRRVLHATPQAQRAHYSRPRAHRETFREAGPARPCAGERNLSAERGRSSPIARTQERAPAPIPTPTRLHPKDRPGPRSSYPVPGPGERETRPRREGGPAPERGRPGPGERETRPRREGDPAPTRAPKPRASRDS
eukprot:1196194-Prorocentrum_minimum.AAC.4